MKRDSLNAQVASTGQTGRKVSFPYFMAFNSLLNNMELIKRIYLNATNGHRYEEVTKGIPHISLYLVSVGVRLVTQKGELNCFQRGSFIPHK